MTNTFQKIASFVPDSEGSLFSIYNLPYGVFKRKNEPARVGTAIGSYVLDLALLEQEGLLKSNSKEPLFNQASLNVFASQGEDTWSAIRHRLQTLLRADNNELQNNPTLLSKALIPQSEVTMLLPFKVENYSDFYASEQHASNVGKLFRGGENPLLPNWKFLPVGYHGRASTVFVSGTDIRRPKGQIKPPTAERPIYTASKKLDYELELGIFVGVGNPDGDRIKVENATNHIFGLVLLNDWSARDVQAFEYQPLGPFLAKSFATSISPWVVTLAALQDFMKPLPKQVPETVDYLNQAAPKLPDIKLSVEIQPKGSNTKTLVAETTPTQLYWSMEQMLAHHTVNHCIMKPGDLLGSGTISGLNRENWGSLLEVTFNGSQPIKLANGEERTFLEDGDTVIMSGFCENEHYKIGFGSVSGVVLPALDS